MSLLEDWLAMGNISKLWSAALVGIGIFWIIMTIMERVYMYGQKQVVGEMTLYQLEDEINRTGRSLIGCMGKIYDVSLEMSYAEGGKMVHFVGKDASVALAKMKLDPSFEYENLHWSRDLNEAEYSILLDWSKKFEAKYDVVAHILEEEKKPEKKLKKKKL